MNGILTTVLAVYMLLGMFFLVASGTLEAFTAGWIDTIHGNTARWELLSIGLLYLLAAFWITALWMLWPIPAVVYLERRKRERQSAP